MCTIEFFDYIFIGIDWQRSINISGMLSFILHLNYCLREGKICGIFPRSLFWNNGKFAMNYIKKIKFLRKKSDFYWTVNCIISQEGTWKFIFWRFITGNLISIFLTYCQKINSLTLFYVKFKVFTWCGKSLLILNHLLSSVFKAHQISIEMNGSNKTTINVEEIL